MNTTTLEVRPSPEHPVPIPLHRPDHPASAHLSASRTSLADRLALRLGLALVLWGRRHVQHERDRVEARNRAVARHALERSRVHRELAAERSALLQLPRR